MPTVPPTSSRIDGVSLLHLRPHGGVSCHGCVSLLHSLRIHHRVLPFPHSPHPPPHPPPHSPHSPHHSSHPPCHSPHPLRQHFRDPARPKSRGGAAPAARPPAPPPQPSFLAGPHR